MQGRFEVSLDDPGNDFDVMMNLLMNLPLDKKAFPTQVE